MPVNHKKIKTCKHCKESFDILDKPKGWMANHVRWCHKNPPREAYLEQKKISKNKPKSPRVVSEKTKKKISEKRKAWLAANPDKHPWKNNSKFKSKPCEKLKETLSSLEIAFVEEFSPISSRGFSIDIAFPDISLGIEVNGNQHYNRDGTLKEYYQNRHDLIEANGWTLIQLHYTDCFIPERILEVLKNRNQPDYSEIFKKKREKEEKRKNKPPKKSQRGIPRPHKRIFDRPSAENLHKMIWSRSLKNLSKEIKCSDNAIKKWCKFYGIPNPPRGFWAKIYNNKLEGQVCPLFAPS
jgi:hypothetical protein